MEKQTTDFVELKTITPSDIVQVGVLTWYSLLDYMRSRRFYILLGIVITMSIVLIIIVGNIMYLWGATAPIITLFAGIFFGADALAGEFQNKTGFLIIPAPIHRTSIYLGKWIASYIASSVVISIYAVVTITTSYFYSSVPPMFGLSYIFTLVFLAAVLGFVFFLSSLSKSITISIFLDFIILVWASLMIQNTAGLVPFEPWFILPYGGQIIGDILADPYPLHEIIGANPLYPKMGGLTTTIYNPTIMQGCSIMGLYCIIPIILGMFCFDRKEF